MKEIIIRSNFASIFFDSLVHPFYMKTSFWGDRSQRY